MITIIALCTLKPESVTEFLSVTKELIQKSKAESGNISYDLFADLENSTKYTFIEVWKDETAIQQHNASTHFQSFANAAGPLFAASLDIQKYEKIS